MEKLDIAQVGERVRAARKGRRMSMEDLAARCGVSKNAIYNLETGQHGDVSASLLACIGEALGVSLDALCGLELPADLAPGLGHLAPDERAAVRLLVERMGRYHGE